MGSIRSFRLIQVAVLDAALVLLVIFAVAVQAVRSFRAASDSVLRTQEVRVQFAEASAHLKDFYNGTRNYLTTGDERLLDAQHQSLADFNRGMAALLQPAAEDRDRRPELQRIHNLVADLAREYDACIALRRSQGAAAVTARLAGGEARRLVDEIRTAAAKLQTAETKRLEGPLEGVRNDTAFTLAILWGGLGLAIALVVTVVLMLRRDFRAREEARAYLESVVDTVREPLVILTDDLRINSANRMFYETFQISPAEALGRPFAEIDGAVWNDTALQSALASVVPQDREMKDFEISREFPRLGAKVMLLNGRKLRRVGNNTSMLLLAIEDVTERKRIETALEYERDLLGKLMDNATELIYFKDRASRFMRINRGLARRFRLADPAEAVGKTDFDFYTTEHARPAYDDEQEVMRTDTPVTKEEKETWPDGTVTWALTVKLPWRDGSGKIVGTYGLSRDITKRRDAEARLQELNATLRIRTTELEAANRELEAFSYSVSHDLRAPLRHIDYFSTALQKHLPPGQLDSKAQRFLATISKSARGMGQLIDDLLSFARIARTELRRTRVRLDEIVAETRQSLHAETNGRSVAWEISPLPEVEGDPALLRQVFMNLLANAVKYTRHRAEARIEIASPAGAPGEVVVLVRDNGAGFDMKYAGKLFGVFQRLHTTEEFEGTGVGLANVRRIIERHGGRTWAEAEVDRGATFFFSLPVSRTSN